LILSGIWKEEEVKRFELWINRKILGLPNDIKSNTIEKLLPYDIKYVKKDDKT
jgi:hypothetical protein